jgi:hypothetical protein
MFRFLPGDAATGQDQVHRAAMADEPWQPDGVEIHQGHAETAAIDAEYRITRRPIGLREEPPPITRC